ncbi:MAG: septum formation family protein [Mycobacterium sp.]
MTPPPDPGPGPYQPGYPYPSPAEHLPPRTTSGWAIAGFVLGLLSCVPLGVIFGIIALAQTKGGRRSGRGLAFAGIVLSGLWVVVGVVAAVVVLIGNSLVTGTVQSSPLVRVGQCFDPDINNSVSCEQPHSDEVFAVLSLSRFPGSGGDDDELTKRCRAELQKYSPSASRDPNVQVVTWGPGTDWKYMNNHTTACDAHSTPNRVGSIKE